MTASSERAFTGLLSRARQRTEKGWSTHADGKETARDAGGRVRNSAREHAAPAVAGRGRRLARGDDVTGGDATDHRHADEEDDHRQGRPGPAGRSGEDERQGPGHRRVREV